MNITVQYGLSFNCLSLSHLTIKTVDACLITKPDTVVETMFLLTPYEYTLFTLYISTHWIKVSNAYKVVCGRHSFNFHLYNDLVSRIMFPVTYHSLDEFTAITIHVFYIKTRSSLNLQSMYMFSIVFSWKPKTFRYHQNPACATLDNNCLVTCRKRISCAYLNGIWRNNCFIFWHNYCTDCIIVSSWNISLVYFSTRIVTDVATRGSLVTSRPMLAMISEFTLSEATICLWMKCEKILWTW